MGNKKLKWKAEEEEALRAGVAKYGTGKWKNILDDPQFARSLIHRSNIDLKDKWRNMTDMPRTQLRGDGPSKKPSDEELDSRYDDVISDAISSSKDAKGSDMNTIFSYIEQRREVPQKFRKLLFGRLKKLVFEGKLEKVDNCYKLKEGIPSDLLESYSRYAAYTVAQAEHKAFLAAEAVKEAERVSAMAEENEALLQLATEIYEQCSMGNDVVLRD